MLIAVIMLICAALAVLANGYGVDSRDGSDDPRRSPYPVGIS